MQTIKQIQTLIFSSLVLTGTALAEVGLQTDDMCISLSCEIGKPTKPLWEVGIGSGVTYSAHYPASESYQFNGVGFPFFVYRGKVFRIGDGGLARAVAVENERVELDFSFAGSFNADSEDDNARAGMPDLDYIFEVGPKLILHSDPIDYPDNSQGRVDLQGHLRGVFSTDFSHVSNQGYVAEIGIGYTRLRAFGAKAKWSAGVASTFATSPLHQYFYGVPGQYATAQRPQYSAKSGYLGTEFKLSGAMPVTDNIRLFVSTKLNYYDGAANQGSPLFRDTANWSFGLGLIWRLFESETRVETKVPS